MTAYSIIMGLTLLAAGIIMLVIGVKAKQERLPKNNWIGIRTRDLLASDEAWIKGHKAAGNLLILSSIPLLVGGALCLVVSDSLIPWISTPAAVLLLAAVLLASWKAHSAVRS